MSKTIKLLTTSLAVLAAALTVTSGTGLAAGSATLSLSPSGANYSTGNNFSVSVMANSAGDPVNVVGADFSYDSSMLQFVGASCNSNVFEVQFPGNSAAGFTCGTSSPKSGSIAVGTATFKVLAGGSASINFASSSNVYRSTDNANIWNGSPFGGSYSFSAATAPVKKKTTPTTASNTTSQQSAPAPVAAVSEITKPETKPVTQTTVTTTPTTTENNNLAGWAAIVLAIVSAVAAYYYFFRRGNKTPQLKTASLTAVTPIATNSKSDKTTKKKNSRK